MENVNPNLPLDAKLTDNDVKSSETHWIDRCISTAQPNQFKNKKKLQTSLCNVADTATVLKLARSPMTRALKNAIHTGIIRSKEKRKRKADALEAQPIRPKRAPSRPKKKKGSSSRVRINSEKTREELDAKKLKTWYEKYPNDSKSTETPDDFFSEIAKGKGQGGAAQFRMRAPPHLRGMMTSCASKCLKKNLKTPMRRRK